MSFSIVGLISSRGGGDWPPVLAIGAEMRARGHRVAMLCDEGTIDSVKASGVIAIQVPSHLEQGVHIDPGWVLRFIESGESIGPDTANPISGWGEVCSPVVIEEIRGCQPDLILSSLFCMGLARQLSDELDTPWWFINPSFYFGDDAPHTWEEDFAGISADMFRHWFGPLAADADAVIHATDQEFDFGFDSSPPNHYYVGPLILSDGDEVPEYLLEPGPPWVLVTVSSVPQPGEEEIIRAALGALADRPVRVLVTLPERSIETAGEIPRNARLVAHAPHGHVLRHSVLAISHAGHGIVTKSLFHGVPMVLVPWGRDQPGVATRAAHLGTAVVVPREHFDAETLRASILSVMDSPVYAERAAEVSARLQGGNPVEEACALIVEGLSG